MISNDCTSYFSEKLKEMFPEKTDQQIFEIIAMVLEGDDGSDEHRYENMVNLLIANDGGNEGAVGYDRAVGYDPSYQPQIPPTIYNNVMSLFPNVCPKYLETLYEKLGDDLEQILEDMFENGYNMIENDPLDLYSTLKQLLPEADPLYLKEKAQELANKTQQDFNLFIENAIMSSDYPTMQNYLKNKKQEDELALYTTNFNVNKYLEQFPNPFQHFSDNDRTNPIQDDDDKKYALNFLFNHYRFIRMKNIITIFNSFNKNLTETCTRLDRFPKNFRNPRQIKNCDSIKNKALLQEIAFLKHRKYIRHVIKLKDDHYRQARENAEKLDLLETCQCCFNEELIPEECYFCRKGCVFCKDCIIRGTKTIIGKGELVFPCFANCDSQFTLRTLQMVLDKNTFELLTQKIQYEELKNANIEGLESCAFCNYVVLLPDTEKVLKCKNIHCMKETCRNCRHEAHIPKRCNEIEYDEDVRRRTYVENKMTEALIRVCYNCKKPFIKSSGCNKMTCGSCSATMCYICCQPIKDYSHFGESPAKCPLHSNDADLDIKRVVAGARQAKADLGNVEIKFDPTINLPQL